MASMTYDLVRQLVERLSAAEQAQLLAYLAPKLLKSVAVPEAAQPPQLTTWEHFFALGDKLQDDPAGESMTQAVISMRR